MKEVRIEEAEKLLREAKENYNEQKNKLTGDTLNKDNSSLKSKIETHTTINLEMLVALYSHSKKSKN